jgi:hypothetical protein
MFEGGILDARILDFLSFRGGLRGWHRPYRLGTLSWRLCLLRADRKIKSLTAYLSEVGVTGKKGV